MKLRYLTVLSALAFLLFSCGNNLPEEQNVPETHELLTVVMQDYTMSTEYPASIQGNQDIKIIPRVEGYSLHNAIVIPQEATYDIQDKVYVVKVVEGKAVASMIQVESATDGKSYIVTDGLKAGEVIIAKGAGFVREGTKINFAN